MKWPWALALCALAACSPAKAPTAKAPAAEVSAPAEPEHFGAPFSDGITAVSLGALIADPTPHEGRVVETEGTVSQVCQAAGCWMELADGSSGERVRTPMAGHAFFLPKTIVGKHARVQGRVELIALSELAKQHLEAEGARATSSKLSLSAMSVSVQ